MQASARGIGGSRERLSFVVDQAGLMKLEPSAGVTSRLSGQHEGMMPACILWHFGGAEEFAASAGAG
ncbi:MAG: hypothetical protein CSA62_10030 [Planctomycetota bacterium]|nr:MAG: hypothetical protein CSA62_10030 [Planctomycetota bacterium]